MRPIEAADKERYVLIHQALDERAAEYGDHIALIDDNGPVTYSQLVSTADSYAAALVAEGVGPGCLVPVRVARSARMVTFLLAVLKTGAAYCPIDVKWPDERVRELLRLLDAPLFLTDTPLAGTRCWTPPSAPPAQPALRTVRAGIGPDDPACVFFTSGSTGTPKGVVTPHRAVLRLFDSGPLAVFGPGRVLPQLAPVGWDACGLEVWGMLSRGGTVVLPDEDHLLPDTLRDLITRHGVNTLVLVASVVNLLVRLDPDCFRGVDQMFIGGERLAPDPVRELLLSHPATTVHNCYGPVESFAFATMHHIRPEDCDREHGVPIGRPVPGTEIHLIDGELCVAGAGLAQGYLHDPERTAEVFVTADVGGVPTRVYRTGDRAVRDADGVLHFLGRADRQVKIRGYRVELGEVESHAADRTGVRDCVAVALAGRSGAYERLALAFTGDADPDRVRAELRDRLPGHLVPDLVRRLDELPHNANGKVDHRAVTELLRVPTPGKGLTMTPYTETTQTIATTETIDAIETIEPIEVRATTEVPETTEVSARAEVGARAGRTGTVRRTEAAAPAEPAGTAPAEATDPIVRDYLTLVDDSMVAVLPHALRIAVELGVADVLDPSTAQPVVKAAELIDADPDALGRLLAALAAAGFFAGDQVTGFRLTALGARLRRDHPDSLAASLVNAESPLAWLRATDTFRTGTASFGDGENNAGDGGFFGVKNTRRGENLAFLRRMRERTGRLYRQAAEAVDWSESKVILDIGGADGFLLGEILAVAPHASGVLFDRPSVIDEVNLRGGVPGCRAVPGDFFASVPTGADTHLLCSVLHDWTDEQAVDILRSSRRALPSGGRLLVIEMLVPEDGGRHVSRWSDLGMMVLTGGRERDRGGFARILEAAGYRVDRVLPVPGSPFSVIEAR
ncbi:AMP-binding protein [Streptomyces sp. NPDC046385]|uniref:AMP-binding protein n=1 Tax=Streptomyces sp. NPDC046385 TaxID=3154918 RepID=UPI0033E6B741